MIRNVEGLSCYKMSLLMNRRKSAFTLIRLLVVIATTGLFYVTGWANDVSGQSHATVLGVGN